MANQHYDLIVRGGTVVSPRGRSNHDIGIREGRIATLGDLSMAEAGEVVEARGLHVLPGMIDSQVHMREPGLEHKEDLETGMLAAAAGGVTVVCEMPNTSPSTTTKAAIADKVSRVKGRAAVDFAFFAGAAVDNIEQLAELECEEGCVGVKIFMGSSTGSLLVPDDDSIRRVLQATHHRVAVHCEDEDRLNERKALLQDDSPPSMHPIWRDEESAFRATRRLVALASENPARIYGMQGKGRIEVGCDADLILVDLGQKRTIEDSWIKSRCGWTPFAGMTVTGWPKMTIVRGQAVMRDDEIVAPGTGRPIRFGRRL